ncbi:hypothetical protein V6Z12_D03G148900 [Gossypium hirsutum]
MNQTRISNIKSTSSDTSSYYMAQLVMLVFSLLHLDSSLEERLAPPPPGIAAPECETWATMITQGQYHPILYSLPLHL